jgi:formate hydrogenlyase subunit 3/multisubunit Na+/H+ antiporter MnhD subunit
MNFAAAQEAKTSAEIITSFLPAVAVAVPLAGSLLVLAAGMLGQKKLRNFVAVLTALAAFAVVLAMYPLVQHGQVVYRFADLMEYGLFLRVDFLGFLFAAIFSASWLLATVYATVYMKSEQAQNRFYVFLLATLGHCLGVVLAGDLFSLFLFFELMTFSSYVLVIHRQTEGALRAGAVAIYMGIAGGLALLMAMFILFFAVGTLEIRPLLEEITAAGVNPLLVIGLFLVGFGIKMGLVPLHIWLPRAYEEAPTPVNVISSAAMLKAGAYGLIRVLTMIFSPASPGAEPAAELLISQVGFAVIWLGTITMLVGAVLALLQDNAKRILGCSSISQMGYVLLGIGVAAFLGVEKGAVGYTGAVYHVLNHSVFKAALFMMVGIIYLNTGEVALSRVRGMMSKVPFVAAMFLVAYAGIAGIPGLNGYASKTLLHHAIVDAYKYGHAGSLQLAERIFMLASALTVVYFAKLFYRLFMGRPRPEHRQLQFKVAPQLKSLLAVYTAAIFSIGLFPSVVLNRFIIPATAGFSFDYASVKYLGKLDFWVSKDLQSVGVVLIMATVLFLAFDHYRVFDWQAPEWLSIERSFYLPLASFLLKACCHFGVTFDSAVNRTYLKSGELAGGACRYISSFDSSLNTAYEKAGGTARHLIEQTERFDGALNEAYEKSGGLARRLADGTQAFDASLNEAYEKSGKLARQLADRAAQADDTLDDFYEQSGRRSRSLWDRMRGRPSDWNIKNLNFDSFLIALMLGLFLFILVYYTKIR